MPVTTDVSEGLGVLTLDNPNQRNALSTQAMNEIIAGLQNLSEAESAGCIIINARGPVFSSGHDLREMIGRGIEEKHSIFELCNVMMETIQQLRQPVIAAVQGPAMAAGCQLVATCDMAIASDSAVFSTPGVKIGLFCSTPMVAVTRAIGRKRALQMLLTGEPVSAATAADWGLINEVVSPESLDLRVRELGKQVSAASSMTLRVGKQAFYKQADLPQPEAYAEMAEVMATNALADDAQEGMGAFLEKRTPVWRNH
ncbi:enoyl-CoA hydratase [Nesterenkonia sphaerica]|uniref:Enoyl-CoA hydratase domain-containing protein 3, mitochondrial n=1 Tax=Nesterenkonia sphaerica TaxID=1804988 RepID=A0A5R9AMG3_9MICC|nr:enoyl-CoA hydratase [Nesterenkonia sphaerica]TLP79344.1 enoyl-CoA hydratase [Nesterenkonia sphaerica]